MAFRTRTRFMANGYDVGGPGDEFAYVPTEVIGQARTSLLSVAYVMEVPDDPAEDQKFYEERGTLMSPENNPQDNAAGVVPLPYETHSNVQVNPIPEDDRTEGERVIDPSSAAGGGFSAPTAPEVQHQMDEEGNVDPAADQEAEVDETPADEPEENAQVMATPGARDLATKEDVDLTKVEGSGEGGRVQKSDVQKFLNESQ